MVFKSFASKRDNTNCELAMPHGEVETSEFYKHIASDGLSEPRRMKQLLTWCATRALGEKPLFSTEDYNARLAGMFRSDRYKGTG